MLVKASFRALETQDGSVGPWKFNIITKNTLSIVLPSLLLEEYDPVHFKLLFVS
jgi:hypothetical protein